MRPFQARARILIPLCLLGSLIGCSQVAYVKSKLADGVDRYCGSVSPAERQLIRSEVNSALAEKGHTIRVTCKQDQEQ